jgi:cytochrome c-type biogenesis protein CcsB
MSILAVIPVAFYILGYYRMPFVYAGFFSQIVYLLSRGIELSRLPLIGPHDTLYFLSASTVLFALPIAWQLINRKRFLYSLIAIAVFFILFSLFFKPHNSPLPPVLKTFWFETHVAFSFFSYALFCIAAILGVLFLVDKGENDPSLHPLLKEGEMELPANEDDMRSRIYFRGKYEILQYKAILVGYSLFSVAMVFGGIWAYLAWGTYWLWTPKELWTVILWLFFSLYLHARLRQWWAGKPSVILGIIGFFIVMFTYLGVSLFMKSSHAF